MLGEPNSKSLFSDSKTYDCLSEGILDNNPGLKITNADVFRDTLFPYFSAHTSPHSQEEYKAILSNPRAQKRITALGVRYLITLVEARTKNDGHGGILCAGGYPGGAGCLGLFWWDRDTFLNAQIWDLGNVILAGNIHIQSTGTGVLPAFILPIPVYMPATETASCQELGDQLGKSINRNK